MTDLSSIELGRIIRGHFEEIWTLILEYGGAALVRYEVVEVAGDKRHVRFMSPEAFCSSKAPSAIKDLCLSKIPSYQRRFSEAEGRDQEIEFEPQRYASSASSWEGSNAKEIVPSS
jgi:hypothetical protein